MNPRIYSIAAVCKWLWATNPFFEILKHLFFIHSWILRRCPIHQSFAIQKVNGLTAAMWRLIAILVNVHLMNTMG